MGPKSLPELLRLVAISGSPRTDEAPEPLEARLCIRASRRGLEGRDVVGLPEHEPGVGVVLGARLLLHCQEHLVRPADHVLALVDELRVSLPHLVPGASERVVGEELHHIPGGEELVPDGQLAAVARRG